MVAERELVGAQSRSDVVHGRLTLSVVRLSLFLRFLASEGRFHPCWAVLFPFFEKYIGQGLIFSISESTLCTHRKASIVCCVGVCRLSRRITSSSVYLVPVPTASVSRGYCSTNPLRARPAPLVTVTCGAAWGFRIKYLFLSELHSVIYGYLN